MKNNDAHASTTENVCSNEEEKLIEKNNESLDSVVIPGERLGSTRDFIPSYGTYVSKGFIFSALLGFCRKHKCSDTTKQFIDIIRLDQLSEEERLKNTFSDNISHNPAKIWSIACLPVIGDYVWARVIRVTHRFVDVDILLSEPTTLKKICPSPYRGTIRSFFHINMKKQSNSCF
jgi:exosome complex RNA-binding protein Csl4